MTALLDQTAIDEAVATLAEGWSGTPAGLVRSVEFRDFLTAVAFIGELAPRCEQLDHHPDLDLRWRRIDIALSTHSAGGVTDKDVELAAVIDELVRDELVRH